MFILASGADAQTLTLAWDPPTDAETSGYLVAYGRASGSYDGSVDVGFNFAYRVTNLASDTMYCFSVRAYSRTGQLSEPSSEVCARTPTGTSAPAPTPAPTNPNEIVLAARAGTARGHWGVSAAADAATGASMRSTGAGWASPNTALAAPSNFFDLGFSAAAATPYRVWLRLRARDDSKWNDSVWVQFSDAYVNGAPAYRIGSTSALLVNLERCSNCGLRGWGWVNSAYWLTQADKLTFGRSGPQTMRIQTREDGVEIDQVVLSAAKYLSTPPGTQTADNTILITSTSTNAGTPYKGVTPVLPGLVEAAHFNEGGAGVAYFDSTQGNAGGALRATDVDLQAASEGGFNVGWTTPGEWMTYTVNVTTARAYNIALRVATVSTASMEISLGAPSSVTRSVSVPNTGGWQRWTTINVPVTLSAGVQTLKVRFTTGGVNLRSLDIR